MTDNGARRTYAHHVEGVREIVQPVEQAFAVLDDHMRLTSHMSRRSLATLGGRMDTVVDSGHAQVVGSVIRVHGRVLGIWLSLEEIVVERDPPWRKAWETIGAPRLLVIGSYRMGFSLEPGSRTRARVWIDYDPPSGIVARALARMFGGLYARWCVQRMLREL